MDYNGCLIQIQQHLQNSPLIVLGSGASAPYGLPSMYSLGNEIKSHTELNADGKFGEFCINLDTMGLEDAINSISLQTSTHDKIREIVWNAINSKDIDFLEKMHNQSAFAIAKLLKKIIQPAPNKATIVTTNYDRLAEYAVDIIGATTVSGFEGNLVRKLEISTAITAQKRVRARERQVEVWKVHGSLDWFKKEDETFISYPLTRKIPQGHIPMIIPPGTDKYKNTHQEPFRSIIGQADKAFGQAGSYLCVGYGFNDEHIQPRLLEGVEKGKPIVVLAKELTDSCRSLIVNSSLKRFIAIESAGNNKTRVYGSGWEEEYDGEFWSLDKFVDIW